MAITTQMRTDVANLYVALFGRAPERDGLGYWVQQLDAGKTLAAVAQEMYNTDPARATYPTFLTNDEIVGRFYTNVLGRTADADGLAYWSAKLGATGATKGSVIAEMITAVRAYAGTDAAALASKALFENKVTVGLYYAVDLGGNDVTKAAAILTNVTKDASSIDVAKNDAATGVGSTYTLTTSVDSIVGTASNDTVNATNTATSAVLGGLDVVDGGAGNDVLNVTDTVIAAGAAFGLPTGFTVKNVETLNVTANGSIGDKAGAVTFDVSGMTGLTAFNATSAGDGTKNHNVKAADTTAVSLTVSAGTTDVTGGKSVSVTGGGAVTIADGGNKALTGVTLTKVDANSGITSDGLTTLTIGGATTAARTVTITNTTAAHSLTVNAAGTGYKADGTTAVQTVVTDTVATSATVNTTAKSSLDLSGSTAVKTVTLTGSGALTLKAMGANATTVDGSAATGNLTLGTLNAATVTVKTGSGNDSLGVAATTKTTIDTGAGNDTVTLTSALAAGSTINLGAGDDKLLVSGGSVAASTATATTVVDAGEGNDTIAAALVAVANAGQFKNFESIDASATANLDIDLMTGSTITGLTLNGDGGVNQTVVVSNIGTGVGLTVAGDNTGAGASAHTFGVKGASTSTTDVFNITFAGAAATTAPVAASIKAGQVTVNDVETVNIASAGGANTWNSISLTDSKLQSLVITGDKNLDLAFAGTNGTVVSSAGGVASIDGSAATGKLNINLANVTTAVTGVTVKGGSAADTFTTAASTATLTGGAGADTYVVTASVAGSGDATTAKITSITDFVAGDKIQLGTLTAATKTNTDIAAATNLTNAIDLALKNAGVGANTAAWFNYGGNTYFVVEDATDGFGGATTNDVIVKLTGVLDLTNAVIAANVLTMA